MKAFFDLSFSEPEKERSSASGITIVSRPGSRRVGGKYHGTVLELIFVVPFCHCPGRSMKAVWGCVGKVRASTSLLLFIRFSTLLTRHRKRTLLDRN